MFSCFEESNQNRIVLQDVDPKALSLLLDYVYSSEIQVNEDNVQVIKKTKPEWLNCFFVCSILKKKIFFLESIAGRQSFANV